MFESLEKHLSESGATFSYPPTPNLTGRVSLTLPPAGATIFRHRPLAWAILLGLVCLAALAIRPVRAGLLDFLQAGDIRIFFVQPTATPQPSATAPAGANSQPTHTPRPTATPVNTILNLSGKTTLLAARQQIDFPILLPTYPPDLGPPNKVYIQSVANKPIVILVWLDEARPEQASLVLYALQLSEGVLGNKFEFRADDVQSTIVNDQPAFWVRGSHVLTFNDPQGQPVSELTRLVSDNVLIWVSEGTTYRLETALPLAEAILIAESAK